MYDCFCPRGCFRPPVPIPDVGTVSECRTERPRNVLLRTVFKRQNKSIPIDYDYLWRSCGPYNVHGPRFPETPRCQGFCKHERVDFTECAARIRRLSAGEWGCSEHLAATCYVEFFPRDRFRIVPKKRDVRPKHQRRIYAYIKRNNIYVQVGYVKIITFRG